MQVCLKSHHWKKMKWYLDNGCSRHMIENKSQFRNLIPKDGGVVKFADGTKSRSIDISNIGKNDSDLIIDVMLVEGLTYNLLSISQFCDEDYRVMFEPFRCVIKDSTSFKIFLITRRHDNTYVLYLDDLLNQNIKCLASFLHEKWIWHKKLRHAHMRLISDISQKELVKSLRKISLDNDSTYEFCQRGKVTKSSFHSKHVVLATRSLELLHLDLFRPTRTASLGGKKYGLVIMDDFSRFTWVIFLVHKDEACEAFKTFSKRVQNEKDFCISSIRLDHSKEFENYVFEKFCNKNGISHNFSYPRTP